MTTTAALAYNPSQLEQFKKTGSCPDCDLIGATVYVNVEPPFNLHDARVSGSRMSLHNADGSDFSGLVAIRSKFDNEIYADVNFKGSVLIQASFYNAKLSGDDFTGADVSGADFELADLYKSTGIDFTKVASVCNAIMPDGSVGKCN